MRHPRPSRALALFLALVNLAAAVVPAAAHAAAHRHEAAHEAEESGHAHHDDGIRVVEDGHGQLHLGLDATPITTRGDTGPAIVVEPVLLRSQIGRASCRERV